MLAIEAPVKDEAMGLLQRCQENDPEACNELFARYNRKIFNTAYRILGEESSAEDALQETLLNVYRGLAKFRGDSKVSTWICRITVNVCLGMIRKSKGKQWVDIEEENVAREMQVESTPQTDPWEHTSLAELQSTIQGAFGRMSDKHSVVVRLHDMEGNTIQEISRIIRCPVGTVKSRLFYGRQEFKDVFSSLMTRGPRPPRIQ